MKRNFAVLPDGICLIGLLLLCFLTACRDNMLIHYNGCRPEVVVPDGIVLIASEAFSGNEQLVSVYLPEGVKTISDEAFMGCTNLRSVLLPTSLTDIGMRAFAGCSSLEEINLQQVRYFHSEGFLNCTALKTVELTEVRELYFGVFYNSGLEEVVGMGYLGKVDDLVFGETPWLTGYLAGNGPDMLTVQNVLWSGYRCVGEVVSGILTQDLSEEKMLEKAVWYCFAHDYAGQIADTDYSGNSSWIDAAMYTKTYVLKEAVVNAVLKMETYKEAPNVSGQYLARISCTLEINASDGWAVQFLGEGKGFKPVWFCVGR